MIFTSLLFSQPLTERYNEFGEIFIKEFKSAPFPHPERMHGHIYDNETYAYRGHYDDSSVAIFIPRRFKPTAETDIVVYFHGWNNNIDSACAQFKLIEQFCESNKNAIFVFPQGPKNSPDSFGGKLEEKDGLKNLIDDVLKFLAEKGKVNSTRPGKIILSGHSGGFEVISYCLMRGGLTEHISDVILFDALYGHTEKFVHWIEKYKGRFIDIYTDGGGTDGESKEMVKQLIKLNISTDTIEEKELTPQLVLTQKMLFIHSLHKHNDIINDPDNFQLFLENTSFLKKIKE